MTFTELSKELGVTPQAIYKRLQRANISLKELKDRKTGELTDEGADRIRQMFRNSPTINKRTREVREISLSGTSKTSLVQLTIDQGQQISRLEFENERLRADLDEWRQRYDDLLKMSFALRAEMEKPAQQAQIQPEKQTEQPQPDQKKAGFFSRIFDKKNRE